MRENVQVASPHSASLKPKRSPLTLQDEDNHFGLGIETVDSIDLCTFVIASQKEEVLGILDFVAEKKADGLN